MPSEDIERIEGVEESTTEKLKRQLREAAEKEREQEELDRITRDGNANYNAGLEDVENAEGYTPPEPSLLDKMMPGQKQPEGPQVNRMERAKSRLMDIKAKLDKNTGYVPRQQPPSPVPKIRHGGFQSPPQQAQPLPQFGGGLNLPAFTGESLRQGSQKAQKGSGYNILGGLPSMNLNLGQPQGRSRPVRGKRPRPQRPQASLLSGLSSGSGINSLYYAQTRRPGKRQKGSKRPRRGSGFQNPFRF